MKTKHTKGEWLITDNLINVECTIRSFDGKRICEVKSFGKGFNDPSITERKANAKLIAAAPDMLSALTSLTGVEAWISDPETRKKFQSTVYKAIKKATE